VRRKGRRDGRGWRWSFWPFREPKQQQPAVEQGETAVFELELKDAAEHDMQRLATEWATLDVHLKPEYCAAVQEVDTATQGVERESAEAAAAAQQLEDAKTAYLALTPPTWSPTAAHLALAALMVAEFALNAVVFQIFAQPRVETWIMAATVGLGLPLLALLGGISLRQERKSPIDQFWIVASPAAAVLMIAGISLARGEFLQGTADILAEVGVRIGVAEATAIFIVLNLALFTVAMYAAYMGSYPDRQAHRRCVVRLRLASKVHAKESREAAAARQRLESALDTLQRRRARRDREFTRCSQEARTLQESAELLVRVYRTANLEARDSGPPPKCFALDPPPTVFPASLTGLDWHCGSSPESAT